LSHYTSPRMPVLPQRFFAREVEVVARALLGCRIQRGEVVLTITEVEAYAGPEDSASHARFGRTERNAPVWGPGGRAYVYLCYGIHNMLNVVADREGRASAVLIRACEPVEGMPVILERRGTSKIGPELLAGPGKVGAALGLDTSWSGHPLHRKGELMLLEGEVPDAIISGPRVGIDFATPEDRDRAWRFAIAGSRAVTQRKLLR
jgi:DNA-3-methyladenine glycosylase